MLFTAEDRKTDKKHKTMRSCSCFHDTISVHTCMHIRIQINTNTQGGGGGDNPLISSFKNCSTYTNALTSNFPSVSGSITPFSVMIPVMLQSGVTSNAGFQQGIPAGALDVKINSSEDLSSIGMLFPDSSVMSNEVIGAAT